MSAKPQLWLLAGGNGAGKSTFYEQFLEPRGVRLVNADRIARAISPESPETASYEAARTAARICSELLNKGMSFCFETVFSHPSKIDFAGAAKALGYDVIIVFIHLGDSSLNVARVAQRVADGGHDVPEEKITSRLPRTLEHIRQAVPLCDELHLVDNSSAEQPFKRIAEMRDGAVVQSVEPLPVWAAGILEDYLEQPAS